MQDDDLIRLHFEGKRFSKHALPLDLLSDLSKLNKLLINIASSIYLEKHPERQRVPKGFSTNNTVALKQIHEGSAVAEITMLNMDAQQHLMLTEESECFSLATDELLDYINNPKTILNESRFELYGDFFNVFGSGLRSDESIDFISKSRKARLDNKKRASLVKNLKSYEEFTKIYGTITEYDKDNQSITINTFDYNSQYLRITADVKGISSDDIFLPFKTGCKVLVYGTAIIKNEKIQKIVEVESITQLPANDIGYRLEELSYLDEGWLGNGVGKKPDKQSLDSLSLLFDDYELPDDRLPYIYPTPDGNLQFEWERGDSSYEMHVNLSTFDSKIYSSESDEVQQLNLKTDVTKVIQILEGE